jgi:hypothetical protein
MTNIKLHKIFICWLWDINQSNDWNYIKNIKCNKWKWIFFWCQDWKEFWWWEKLLFFILYSILYNRLSLFIFSLNYICYSPFLRKLKKKIYFAKNENKMILHCQFILNLSLFVQQIDQLFFEDEKEVN